MDLSKVRRRKRDIVDSWSESNRKGLEKHEGVELIEGDARFVGDKELEVTLSGGGRRRLSAPRIFLNVGARPRIPPLRGLEGVPFLDSTTVMELGEVPGHLIVLGGGFVGLEFAQMFRRFGAEVTVVERAERIAGREDPDVAEEMRTILEEDGIDVRTGATVSRVEESGERAEEGRIRVRLEAGEGPPEVTGSHLLVAVGRTPNTDGLAVEATGLSLDERGYVPVNGRRETAVEGIWALGDVTGGPPFTHTSYDDFRIVRENLLEGGDATADDRILTYTVFTDPQLGRAGLGEEEARERGYDIRVAKLPMSRVARAIETDETRGFMKAVVEVGTERILGAAVLGVEGGEVVSVLLTAMMGGLPWTALRDGVYAHPTLAESLNNLFMTLDE